MSLKLLKGFTDVLGEPEEIGDSQPLSLSPLETFERQHGSGFAVNVSTNCGQEPIPIIKRPAKGTGQRGEFRCADEIDAKYRNVFSYPFFNLVQSRVIDDALYSDKSMVVCAPTGSGKTVVFEMAIVQLLMELEDKNDSRDFKIIYMAPVKALCTERLTEWYPKFTKLGLLCIEVTGDTDVDFTQLKPYRIIITTPEKWDMLTRRWRDHRQLVELIKLFLIDEVHILNDNTRGPVLEAVVSRMKTIESSVQSTHRIEQLQQQYQGNAESSSSTASPNIRFIAVSATVGNPEDVATWLGTEGKPAVYYKFGDECRPVKLKRVVEGYHCAEGSSIFKFDLVLNYKLWPIIQRYHDGKPTLIFCNTRKSVALTAETLSREITITFNEEQKARLNALASKIKNKKLQTLVLSGVGCHHAGLLYEERTNIEQAFRNRDLPILITTTTLAMGVNLPAHLVIIKNTQQYINGAYQEYSISTILQMVGRAGRPQFDTEATAVIMTRFCDKLRYQALVGGSEPLQSYLHKRLPENLNSEAALGTVSDVAQCVQWLRSTFLYVRAARDPKRYLSLPPKAPSNQISKKIEELCVKAMNGLASSGLITMDEACCIESTEAGRLMSIYYIDLETMKHIMRINGSESLERLLMVVCESHELADMHLRMDERRCLNALNRNNTGSTIRFPIKGKITTRQLKLNCVIQASLGCLPIPDPSLNQEATKVMRIADRVCKCLVAYVTRPGLISQQPKYYSAVLNSIILAKCITANLWENSPFVCKQLRGIGPTFSTLLATAGKSNFMLLEESHPRDLERIMNKGPPAGNIIRKQISLFPKYQLTANPVDEKEVAIELKLLNHHNLVENLENLTAGPAHKGYIIIGDSENTLLMLNSFKDSHLISVYDGSITFKVTRKYGFEHKVYAHCVSTTIAGIDANCEYLFKDIEPQLNQYSNFTENIALNTPKRQTTITDTFRERKRKNTDSEITHSKEKKKRDSALFEKYKNLKESFSKTAKVLKDELEKSSVMENIIQSRTDLEQPVRQNEYSTDENFGRGEESIKSTFFESPKTYEINDDDFINDFVDKEKINNILHEIENEISKESNQTKGLDRTQLINKDKCSTQKPIDTKPSSMKSNLSRYSYTSTDKRNNMNYSSKRVKNITKKSNYNFIRDIENNVAMNDDEESKVQEENSFSDAIRTHVEKYLLKTKSYIRTPDIHYYVQNEPILQQDTEEMAPAITVENSVREKHVTLDETLLLELLNNKTKNSNNTTNNDNSINNVLELNQRMKSIDLSINDMPVIDLHTQGSSNEHEFLIVDLDKKTSKLKKTYSDVIYTEHNNINKGEANGCEVNNMIKLDSDNLIPKKDKNAFIYCNKLNRDSDSNMPKLLSEICKIALVPSIKPCIAYSDENDKLNDSDSIIAFQNTVFSYSSPEENNGNTAHVIDIQLPKSKEPNENENIVSGIPNADAASKTHISELNKQQPVLELRKNYIKELPLELGINEMNKNNRIHSSDVISTKLSNQPHKEKENLKLSVKSSNKNKNFTPPYKHNNYKAVEKCEHLMSPDSNNIATALLETKNKTKTQPETETTKIINSIQESILNAPTGNLSNPLQSIEYRNEFPVEIDSNKAVDSVTSKRKENKEVITCNVVSTSDNKQPLSTQQFFCKIPCGSSTECHLLDTDKHQNLSHLKQLNYQITKNTTTGNLLTLQQSYYKSLLPTTSKLIEIELLNDGDKDVAINSNPNMCALGDQITISHKNEQVPTNKSQKHYINQYLYSTNKIGVSTRETADHVVRIIRKLRIDLDVTEIISESKNIANNNEVPHNQDDSTKLANVLNNEPTKVMEYKSVHDSLIAEPFDEESKPLTNARHSKMKYMDERHKDCLHESKQNKSEDEPAQIKSITVVESEEDKPLRKESIKDVEKINKERLTMFGSYKDVSTESKSNSVESILLKYSNLMRHRNTRTIDSSITQIKEKCLMPNKTEKPNRPFKISDIHRLKPNPLPEVFIEKPKGINVLECLNELNPDDQHAKQDETKSYVCETLRHNTDPTAQEYLYAKDITEKTAIKEIEQLSDCNQPNMEGERFMEAKETITDIDQTMFNPKTLLQCYSKDSLEDFVPPPLEFSDYFNETATTSTDTTLLTDNIYEPIVWEESVSLEETPNGSIFQESQTELTPSKEIETWNLSQDEGPQMYVSPGMSPYSFTMIHNKKEQYMEKPPATWKMSQEDKARCKKYAVPDLGLYSFGTKSSRISGSVERNQTQQRKINLKQFKFIRKSKNL